MWKGNLRRWDGRYGRKKKRSRNLWKNDRSGVWKRRLRWDVSGRGGKIYRKKRGRKMGYDSREGCDELNGRNRKVFWRCGGKYKIRREFRFLKWEIGR